MSIAERRLFKLAGQLRQIHKNAEMRNPMKLREKAMRGLRWAQTRWEDLEPCTVDDLRTLVYVENLAGRVGQVGRDFRLQEHYRKMETDLPAAQRWVNMPMDYDAWVQGEPIHPQGRANDLAEKWRNWWQTPGPGVEGIRDILENVAPCPGAERPRIEGEALMRIVKASKGKAAGADGWSPDELCLLPDGFFEAVAMIWDLGSGPSGRGTAPELEGYSMRRDPQSRWRGIEAALDILHLLEMRVHGAPREDVGLDR